MQAFPANCFLQCWVLNFPQGRNHTIPLCLKQVLGSYVFLKPFEAESVYPSRKGCNVVAFFFQDYIQVGESHFMQLYCHLCWNMIWNSPSNHAYAYVSCKVKVSLLVELFWKILFKFLTGFKFTHHFRDSVVWWFFSFWSTFPTPPPPPPKKKKTAKFLKKENSRTPRTWVVFHEGFVTCRSHLWRKFLHGILTRWFPTHGL